MSSAYGRNARAFDYGNPHSQSTGDLQLSLRPHDEQQQCVEGGETHQRDSQRSCHRGTEPSYRPSFRDHRATTYDTSDDRRFKGWGDFRQMRGAEFSQQETQHDGSNDQYDGDDDDDDDEYDDDHHRRHGRRERRRSDRNHEPSSRKDPPIARFVRSKGQRKSSSGRAFFSPSGLQDSQKWVTRPGAAEIPLLPMPHPHTADSLSHAALEFAHIRSGDWRKCVKFLKDHERLLHEDYHPYLQEAWIALWDEDKHHAHRCLSRWYLLDECRQIWPRDIAKHINQRGFDGDRFMDEVDAMCKTLNRLRQRILDERSSGTATWSFRGVRGFFQEVNRATVLNKVGNVYKVVAEVAEVVSEIRGNGREVRIQI